jgi:hypothetical protein
VLLSAVFHPSSRIAESWELEIASTNESISEDIISGGEPVDVCLQLADLFDRTALVIEENLTLFSDEMTIILSKPRDAVLGELG